MVKTHHSFSSRITWLCTTCFVKRKRKIEAWSQIGCWLFVVGAVLAGPMLDPGLASLGIAIGGYLAGTLVGLMAHEAAHALTAVALGLRVWRIELGVGQRWSGFRLGCIQVNLRRLPTMGLVVIEPTIGAWAAIRMGAAILAGPMINLLLAWAAWRCIVAVETAALPEIWRVFAGCFLIAQLVMAVVNLWPQLIGDGGLQLPSDGKSLWQLARDGGKIHRDNRHQLARTIELHERMSRNENTTVLKLIEAAPHDAADRLALEINATVVLIRLGRFGEAYDTGTRLLAGNDLEPITKAVIQNNTAWAGLLDGRRDQIDAFTGYVEAALINLPGHFALLGTRAACAIANGDTEQGRRLIRESMAQDEDGVYRPIHTAWLAVADLIDNRLDEAAEMILTARRLAPDSAEVDAIIKHYCEESR